MLEDTTFGLPEGTSEDVRRLVEEMTFKSFSEETAQIWFKSDEAKLLKLYDKVSNLLDGSWMSSEKRTSYLAYSMNLCMAVRPKYGELNIMRMALTIPE
ncbi:MAG: hypothetical protein A3J47_01870 [Candidatus Yanofskybacteria bacterium RIFCSPHIGHO2_02_FULL_43_22]|uniref:Uncharacterized protein n=1 Tax=Candidatus Yanofskybacteria bacterium RIFCSPHIGHO2_02_FULL_43_22 TaxID=1802681 RepID=A0A1F8FPK4_9BACT|nr:MAG: hypothetical protein A3J47_01870 [Candidatus Yanofskybacteria bacterium RIFCSPHIGHO2_02_FULL_43_22]